MMSGINWINYLRSSIILLVVAHHSALAYTTFAYFNKQAYILSTHPVVDPKRWIGFDIFVSFNDIFFMSLLFLAGGLFLSKSIAKRGVGNFILARTCRLFLPFIFLGTWLMLVAYFPAYYVSHGSTDIVGYIKDFFTIEQWPVGPPWFLWVLFSFNLLFVLVNPVIQKLKPGINRLFYRLQYRPAALFLSLFLITWMLYIPLACFAGAETWTGFGPFDFQISRILLYFGYFIIGVLIGNTDFNYSLFSLDSVVIKKWWLWILLSLITFSILTAGTKILPQIVLSLGLKEFAARLIYYTLFAASCTFSCLAFITGFRKLVHSSKRWWNSLSDNSYLIYLIHYVFVVWVQFLLIDRAMPAFVKFLITFISAISLSWITAVRLKRIPIIRQYL